MEGGLFKGATTILTTAVVEDKDDVPLLCHVGFPGTRSPVPGCLHIVGMRTAIDIDHCGIFLLRVEICGFHHAVIEIGDTIGGLDATALENGLLIASPWVFSL